jgi:hypothetical protein
MIFFQAFLSNEYQTKHPDEYSRTLTEKIKQLLADQVVLIAIFVC